MLLTIKISKKNTICRSPIDTTPFYSETFQSNRFSSIERFPMSHSLIDSIWYNTETIYSNLSIRTSSQSKENTPRRRYIDSPWLLATYSQPFFSLGSQSFSPDRFGSMIRSLANPNKFISPTAVRLPHCWSIASLDIHHCLSVDPSLMVVTWVTLNQINDSVVEYSTDTSLNSRATGTVSVFQDSGSEKRREYVHRVVLRNLTPGQKYCR